MSGKCMCCSMIKLSASTPVTFFTGMAIGVLSLARAYPLVLCPKHDAEFARSLDKIQDEVDRLEEADADSAPLSPGTFLN